MMKTFLLMVCCVVVFSSPVLGSGHEKLTEAEALQLVQPFYDFLSGKATEAEVRPAFAESWKSFYANGEENYKDLEQTMGFLAGPLRQMVPNLSWEIKEVLVTDDNRIIVRGEATGQPAGDSFMGMPIAAGKSFTIMSIDIHSVTGGKITKTYHIEAWANAFKQLAKK